MPATQSRKTSIRTRIRHITTMCCVLACLAGIVALAYGHVIHGALLMLGALLLVPGTIWGRRRRPHLRLVYSAAQGTLPDSRSAKRPRKVA